MKVEFEDEVNVDAVENRATTLTNGSSKLRSLAAPPRRRVKKGTTVDNVQLKEALSAGAHHSSAYVFDVFLHALRLMRIPLSTLLFLWMLASVMMRLLDALRTVFVPICHLPLVSRLVLCGVVVSPNSQGPQWADFPKLMQVQSSMFEQLLAGSIGGSVLSLEIQKVEFATADLATLVRNSDIESNEILANLLEMFVKDAERTARGLTTLSSRVGGTVDNTESFVLIFENTEKNIPPPYSLTALMPFRTGPSMQEVTIEAFAGAMEAFSTAIQRLILEAEKSLHNLDILEEDLSSVYEVVIHEDISITAQKSELLGALWTKLGGNQCTLMDYERCLSLLKDLGNYRKYAHVHVVAALQTLHSMGEDMEDLRQRVAAPELINDRRIPLHVHIESIQNGLQRLQEGWVRTKEMEEDTMTRVLGLDTD
ncbi:uncharacterized protein F5147DRAFT_659749 [Suillus discolor]|uniref:Uncharacterized protein n=1 Tax=Suillus discolor TaxID=1912936 RepID=A0A9P7EQM2_9AGAM|nr:uncharacterized protein F5147DRAFT_659749 [Suillus discolor]KAG2084695.1 hypothetical protein F5147DRAFT_659749 [Suillus discolor]